MARIIQLAGIIVIVLLFPILAISAVSASHPRLLLTSFVITEFVKRANANTPQWARLINTVNGSYYSEPNEYMLNNALVYQIKQNNSDTTSLKRL